MSISGGDRYWWSWALLKGHDGGRKRFNIVRYNLLGEAPQRLERSWKGVVRLVARGRKAVGFNAPAGELESSWSWASVNSWIGSPGTSFSSRARSVESVEMKRG